MLFDNQRADDIFRESDSYPKQRNAKMTNQSLELLNGIQKFLLDFANANQIDLRKEFGSVEEFKKFVIALAFDQLVKLGVPVKDAFDMVLGDGEYDKLVEKAWAAAQ